MYRKLCIVSAALAMVTGAALAQEGAVMAGNPITASERGFYGIVSAEVIAAAEKMPEKEYSFRPTPEVRTFGQLVGHVADAQYEFCSLGETAPMKDVEKTKVTKADLIASLKEAVAYCNKAYAGMTDAEGSNMTKFGSFKVAKLTMFTINTAHMDEHYGNIVTYLRMKGIVPPSSEKQPAAGKQ